jgi:hypothetical protein
MKCKCAQIAYRNNLDGSRDFMTIGKSSCKICRGSGWVCFCLRCAGSGISKNERCIECDGHGKKRQEGTDR